jgi:chromosome segregation ATPase
MNDSLSSPLQQVGSHGLSLSSSSPLKRLERLSDDIKIERDKATNALQEKARLKIEMESLKQQLNNQIIETTEYRKSVDASDTLIRSLKESLNELRSTEDKLRSDIKISNINNEELDSYIREQKLKYQSISYEMELLNDKLSKLQITNDGLDGRIQAKDQLIDEYKDEISRLKKTIKSNDDKVNLITQALNTSVQSNEELKLKARKADNIHQTYMQLLKSYDDLKREYESVSISNETLDQKLKDSIITLEEKVKGAAIKARATGYHIYVYPYHIWYIYIYIL